MFKCWQLDVVVVDAACILYPVVLARFAETREAAGMLDKGRLVRLQAKGTAGGHVPPSTSVPCCSVMRSIKGDGPRWKCWSEACCNNSEVIRNGSNVSCVRISPRAVELVPDGDQSRSRGSTTLDLGKVQFRWSLNDCLNYKYVQFTSKLCYFVHFTHNIICFFISPHKLNFHFKFCRVVVDITMNIKELLLFFHCYFNFEI